MTPDANAGRTSTTSPAGQNTPDRGRLYAVPSSHGVDEMSPVQADRQPPHDLALERDLLRVVLLHGDYPTTVDEAATSPSTVLGDVVATGLRPEHFYAPAHVRVWAAVLELCAEAQPVDVHTVSARCSDKRDVLDLMQCSESTVRTPAPAWAMLVIEKARCRRLLPMVEEALDELLAGRLRHVRLVLEDVAAELAS